MTPVVQPTVLLVDDVEIDVRRYFRALSVVNTYKVKIARSVDEALVFAEENKIDAAILDLKMPPGRLGDIETNYGEETGYALASKLIETNKNIGIIILSHVEAGNDLESAIRAKLNIRDVLLKLDTKPIDLIRSLDSIFGRRSMTPTLFIVHGHDRDLIEFIQDVVTNELKWDKPIVLDEQAGGGLTIIEKFEKFASSAEGVIVLLTPDDVGASSKDLTAQQFRARQNVFFELGYFYGKFRRQSGRVFLIKKGVMEIPSDLSGVVYVDVDNIISARTVIVRELQHAFRALGF